jgi:hypothetical protein
MSGLFRSGGLGFFQGVNRKASVQTSSPKTGSIILPRIDALVSSILSGEVPLDGLDHTLKIGLEAEDVRAQERNFHPRVPTARPPPSEEILEPQRIQVFCAHVQRFHLNHFLAMHRLGVIAA